MLRNELEKRKRQLEHYTQICESFLKRAPIGSLRISSSRWNLTYYMAERGQTDRKLLTLEKDKDLIKALAQKDYYRKVLKVIRKELLAIKSILDQEKDQPISTVYSDLSEVRRKLVEPLEESLESRRAKFEALEAPPLVIQGDKRMENPHVTLKGEHVRSAAERTIANALKKAGIPYKYEYPYLCKSTTGRKTLQSDAHKLVIM